MTRAAPAASEPRAFESRVLRVLDECAGVKTLRLAVPEDFAFVPGMWLMLHFPDEPKRPRAYSIASSPYERGAVEVSVKRVGPLTERLFGLKGGETLSLRGPYGKWRYRDSDRHAVLISGGTGIGPFRSMARYVLETGLPNRLTILYSARTPAEIVYRAELESFAKAGIRVYTTITKPPPAGAGPAWDGPVGRLSVEVVAREVPDYAQASYYLCGPASLVSEMTAGLEGRGIPRERIRYEKWGDY